MKCIFIYLYVLFFKIIESFKTFIPKCVFYKTNKIIKSLSGILQNIPYITSKKEINSLNTSISSINTNLTGISYNAGSGTTINNNLIAKSITDNGSLIVNNGLSVSGSVSLPVNSIATAAINNNGYFAITSDLSNYLLSSTASSTYALISS